MKNGCAWCSPSGDGTDGICDTCMKTFFGVDPVAIHREIEQESNQAGQSLAIVEGAERKEVAR